MERERMAVQTPPRKKTGARSSSGSSTGRSKARDVIRFIEHSLRHTKGPLAGQPFRLTDWQRRDIIEPIYGTLLADGRRQWRTVFVELPRKNGKSGLASAIALVALVFDGEAGAEVLCLASSDDQSRVVFDECKRMVEASPEIREAFNPVVYRDAIEIPETNSVLRVLSADEKNIHGRNPSALILDELHTFTSRKQREFFIGATTAMGARSNPLTVMITTSGFDKSSVAYELHQYAHEIRTGIRQDPSFLSCYWGAPEEADWTDRNVWRAANPALSGRGAFLSMEYLEAEFLQAEAMPSRQNAFRTFFLNQWVGQEERFIDLNVWDTSQGHRTSLEDTTGRTGYIGLDLSAVSDLTARVLVLPCRETEGAWDVQMACYLPEASLDGHKHSDLYRHYKAGGWLTTTPGDVIDYRYVETEILALAKRLNVRAINVDTRFQGIQVATQLKEHRIDVREFPQTHAAFAAPMKELERLLKAGRLHHGGNPILRWAMDHLVVDIDSHGDAKPSKTRAMEKIDPVVGLLMAIDLAIRQQTVKPREPQMFFLSSRR